MEEISLDGVKLIGIEVDLPNSPPLILIKGNRSFAMCGFLNVEAADRAGVAAIMSSGVNSVEDLLNAPVKGCTSKALEMGAKIGEKVSESLRRMEME